MWLPKDERKLLRYYYLKIGKAKIEWYCWGLNSKLAVKIMRKELNEFNTSRYDD